MLANKSILRRETWRGISIVPFGLSLTVYSVFALVVYFLHGPEPGLSVDHIAYFRMANEIMAAHPDGSYWRDIAVIRSYGVLMAYLHPWTGSHIASLKLILGVTTVLHLLSFELLMTLFTDSKRRAMLFSLLAVVSVSFGASFWGVTDFSASLNRGLAMPFFIAVVWFTLRYIDTPWRHLAYSILALLSILHLSAYYLIAVLALGYLVEAGMDKFRDRRSLGYFLGGILLAYATQKFLALAGLTNVHYVGVTLNFGGEVTSAEAWEVELFALPWRNMPLPFTTILTIAASYGVILLLAVSGAVQCYRRGLTRIDQFMLIFAAAAIIGSYGLQTSLWMLRQFTTVYPLNFEEVRIINFIMIPSLYFVFRLYSHYRDEAVASTRRIAPPLIVLLVLLQPIMLLRVSPGAVREWIYATALESGLIRKDDTLRQIYARQTLGLDRDQERYYYSVRNLLDWLRQNVSKEARILTDLNEVELVGANIVGAHIGFLRKDIRSRERLEWMTGVHDTQAAFASHDLAQVTVVARKYGATLAIVPWPVQDALYQDAKYSVIRIPL
jgi:hypothetical protein